MSIRAQDITNSLAPGVLGVVTKTSITDCIFHWIMLIQSWKI